MRRQDAVVVTLCAGVVVTCALYVVTPRAPIYYPIEHVWRWEPTPGVAMRWYGRSAVAIGGGALAMLLTWPLSRRLAARWDSGPPAWFPKVAALVLLAAVAGALGQTVVHEWHDWMTR
ncbi:MAG: hypothetical protein HYZ29_19345 [Myxococcales bacterium]|nr:hypothetical protein [Myxococcales bacterium]